jgi:uncharacterized protein
MTTNKETLVIGASENPERYSWKAANNLKAKGFKVKLLGKSYGTINGEKILTGFPKFENIHTVTLYINPTKQSAYYQYIIDLKPKRVIFNPGTENAEFEELLRKNNIEAEEACTLVLLSLNAF